MDEFYSVKFIKDKMTGFSQKGKLESLLKLKWKLIWVIFPKLNGKVESLYKL